MSQPSTGALALNITTGSALKSGLGEVSTGRGSAGLTSSVRLGGGGKLGATALGTDSSHYTQLCTKSPEIPPTAVGGSVQILSTRIS